MALPSLKAAWSPNFSSRNGAKVTCIVVHDCEGSYLGSVGWFLMAKSEVSAHIVLNEDGTEATWMVKWGNKAWHACNINSKSEGIEAAGYSAKGLGAPEWAALASIVAFRLHANGILCQRATAENGWVGFCQHVDLGAMGGGHHDITHDEAVWAAFDAMVHKAYEGPQPAAWAPFSSRQAIAVPPTTFKPSNTQRHDLDTGSIEWTQMKLNHWLESPGQESLAYMGVLSVDGMEGEATEAALKKFQGTKGLGEDGIVGPLTINALSAVA